MTDAGVRTGNRAEEECSPGKGVLGLYGRVELNNKGNRLNSVFRTLVESSVWQRDPVSSRPPLVLVKRS